MTEQEANKLPLEDHALQVCYAIEECGASTKLTTAVVLASALQSRIKEIVARTKAVTVMANTRRSGKMLVSSPGSADGCEAEYQARLEDYKRTGGFHEKQAAVAALNAWEEALSADNPPNVLMSDGANNER